MDETCTTDATTEVRLSVGGHEVTDCVAELSVEVRVDRLAAETVLRDYLRNTSLGEMEEGASDVVGEILAAAL